MAVPGTRGHRGEGGGLENARWPEPGAAVQHGRQKSRDWQWQGLAFAAAATQWGGVKTAEVAGARGCSAAEYFKGARSAWKGPQYPSVGGG